MDRRNQRQRSKCAPNIQIDGELNKILKDIESGYRVLIMMRGLPGSGKSTLAGFIMNHSGIENGEYHILSADDYFKRKGTYKYDVTQLGDAHAWNQTRAKNYMAQGFSPVIIDNTHTEVWEMHCYINDGVKNGYIVKILEPKTAWASSARELANRNSHGVPIQKIKVMQQRYNTGVTVKSLLQSWKLVYPSNMTPPVMRLAPPIVAAKVEVKEINNAQTGQNFSLMAERPKPQRNRLEIKKESLLNSNSTDWETINETLNAWEKMSPMNCNPSSSNGVPSFKCDSSTNTNSSDFNHGNFKILTGICREINGASSSSFDNFPKQYCTRDYSTMTDEIHTISEVQEAKESQKYKQDIEQLKLLFPEVYEQNLRHVFEECNRDINWTVEILLDSKTEGELIQIAKPSDQPDEEDKISIENLDVLNESPNVENLESFSQLGMEETCSKPVEDTMMLKKEIEKNFIFSDDHYSEHLLKIKRRNRGENPKISFESNESVENPNESPECSNSSSPESPEEADEKDEVVSLNVGNQFIEALEKVFDYSSYSVGNQLDPIIHIPMSLLHQIHALWLESVYHQIDLQQESLKKMIKEDEEFARNLKLLENSHPGMPTIQETPNLKEIMDMEMALALYKTDIMEWKKETPDTLASRLTRQKLIQLFPEINSDTLLEVLNAYDNDFTQTVQVLMVSTGQYELTDDENENKKAIQQLLIKHERDLLERAKKEKEKLMSSEQDEIIDRSSPEDKKAMIDLYRQEANRHLEIRNLNFTKAQTYLRKGMTQVATYYSSIAALHTKRHDIATTVVASKIVQGTTLNDDYTLDLHSLNLIEAVKVLDLFIDKHKAQLQRQRNLRPYSMIKLFLVTGRGRHSPGGQPRIKPAVCRRLRERQIRYSEVNPGLIGIEITAD